MAGRMTQTPETIGRSHVHITGKFVTAAGGTISSYSVDGGAATVTRDSEGVYKINLGASTTDPDRYPGGLLSSATELVSSVKGYNVKITTDASTAAAPYVTVTSFVSANAELVAGLRTYNMLAHDRPDSVITTANASDLATSKALAKALAQWAEAHGPSTTVHKATDATGLACAAWASKPNVPADLTEVQNVLNELKSDYNTHYASTTYHRVASSRGAVSTSNATDQSTANALANALKARFNLDAVDAASDHAADLPSGTVYFHLVLKKSV